MVSSYLELIERRYKGKALDSKAEEYMHYAIDGADRMRRMIDDLLTYSRVDTQVKAFTTVNMEDVLRTALKDLRKSIEDSSASITSTPMPEINADRTQMLVLLENLIGNAIKFRGKISKDKHLSKRYWQRMDLLHRGQRYRHRPYTGGPNVPNVPAFPFPSGV